MTLILSFPLTASAAVKISKKSVASVSSKGVVTAKKKGTAIITAKIGKKKYTCKITVRNPLTAKQAGKAVKKYLSKKNFRFWLYSPQKQGKNYIIWASYTQTGVKSKFIVNSITGKTCSYAPYWGINMTVGSPAKEYQFNAYKYL